MSESLLTLQYELKSIEETLVKLKTELEELKTALKLMDELKPKSVYKTFGNRLIIEMDPSKAKELVEEEIEKLELKVKALENQRSKLLKELEELKEKLNVGP